MSVVHRLVLVLGFFGGLFVVLMLQPGPHGLPFWTALLPLAVAAVVIYPIVWIFSGLRS